MAPRYSFQIGNLARAFARPQGTEDRIPACPGKQEPCVGAHPEPAACVRGWAKKQTRSANCPAQPRDLPTAGVLGAGAGFFPAQENRSSAWARSRKEPRACAVQMQTQTGCAICSPQVRGRARLSEGTNPVRDLLGAAARGRKDTVRDLPTAGVLGAAAGFLPARENRSSAWACTRKEPRACETGQSQKQGARLARRRRATCSAQPRRRKSSAKLCGK